MDTIDLNLLFYKWCDANIRGFKDIREGNYVKCYVDDVLIGGFTVDTQKAFLYPNEKTKELLKKFAKCHAL